MPRRNHKSLQYELMEGFAFSQNRNTVKQQKRTISAFADYCKGVGIKIDVLRRDPIPALQGYYNGLIDAGYTVSTAHTYISAPCKALGVGMALIDKIRRTADTITRGRGGGSERGRVEADQTRYARLVSVQQAVGIRRAELARLRGRDLHVDVFGQMYIDVERGKGGKHQHQYILPGREQDVLAAFAGVKPDQRVFSRKDMENHINLHGYRAGVARDAYRYYADMCKTQAGRDALDGRLMAAYADLHYDGTAAKAAAWLVETATDTPYKIRGANRQKAIAQGLPVEYDRRALLAVSVFHLSHWRLDVTVTNYILAT